MGKNKKKNKDSKGNNNNFISIKLIVQIIIITIVLLGLCFSLSISQSVIKINDSEWYIIFFKSLIIIIPLFLLIYLNIKKEDYFENSVIAILLSCFTALYISLVYSAFLDYSNIQKSKNNPLLIQECDISLVVKSNSKLKVSYDFKGIRDFFYCMPKGLINYYHLNNNKDKIKIRVEYREGIEGTFIINNYELINL